MQIILKLLNRNHYLNQLMKNKMKNRKLILTLVILMMIINTIKIQGNNIMIQRNIQLKSLSQLMMKQNYGKNTF